MSPVLIERREDVCRGSPIIKGTRIRVADVVRYYRLLAREMVIERIVQALPHLTPEQVRAALDYYDRHRYEIERELREEDRLFAEHGEP